jgi:FkbM family methyltransferase
MNFKDYDYEYPWTTTTKWLLPADELMMQNQFAIMDQQIDEVLRHCTKKRICVQAGGAFGMYPLRLAYHFHRVHTFEPLAENFTCLARNIDDQKHNIEARQVALWNTDETVYMEYSKPKKNSYGAHHVVKAAIDCKHALRPTTGVRLDFYGFEHVDLIWLDIEGSELYALEGARETIDLWRPTIVIEERPLPQMRQLKVRVGQARNFLMKEFGYKIVSKSHGDLIMRCIS